MNSTKTQSILLGGGFAAVLSILFAAVAPSMMGNQVTSSILGVLACCLVPMVGSFLAVWNYTNAESLTLASGEGAGMGAITLVFASIVSGAVNMLLQTIGVLPSAEETLEIQRQQLIDQGMSADQVDQTLSFAQTLSNPILGLVIGIVISAVVGAIFGAIAAAVFKKGETV